jgi:hypothetical protein
VRCLDGGAWDRPTWRGSFAARSDAVAHAVAIRLAFLCDPSSCP